MDTYFTREELNMILMMVNKKMRQEARRPARFLNNGSDVQSLKVRTLADIREKLNSLMMEVLERDNDEV